MSKWFHYDQNNSGGSFGGPAINVWVEARSAEEANGIAEGHDCECCGDRWHSAYGEGKDKPEPQSPYAMNWSTKKIPHALLVYLDGRREEVSFDPTKEKKYANS